MFFNKKEPEQQFKPWYLVAILGVAVLVGLSIGFQAEKANKEVAIAVPQYAKAPKTAVAIPNFTKKLQGKLTPQSKTTKRSAPKTSQPTPQYTQPSQPPVDYIPPSEGSLPVDQMAADRGMFLLADTVYYLDAELGSMKGTITEAYLTAFCAEDDNYASLGYGSVEECVADYLENAQQIAQLGGFAREQARERIDARVDQIVTHIATTVPVRIENISAALNHLIDLHDSQAVKTAIQLAVAEIKEKSNIDDTIKAISDTIEGIITDQVIRDLIKSTNAYATLQEGELRSKIKSKLSEQPIANLISQAVTVIKTNTQIDETIDTIQAAVSQAIEDEVVKGALQQAHEDQIFLNTMAAIVTKVKEAIDIRGRVDVALGALEQDLALLYVENWIDEANYAKGFVKNSTAYDTTNIDAYIQTLQRLWAGLANGADGSDTIDQAKQASAPLIATNNAVEFGNDLNILHGYLINVNDLELSLIHI